MKQKRLLSTLLALCAALALLTLSASAASDNLTQDDTHTYTIHNAAGWNEFCTLLTYQSFSNITVNLNADITVTTMAGSSGHDFTGTFDGQGHTLTVRYGSSGSPKSENYAAPFRYAESGCVIRDLRVAGDIYISKKFAAGIIAAQYGTVRIENCRSSVVIHSSTDGDGTHGGLVAEHHSGAALTIQGCTFDGKLLNEGATTQCGGFVGFKNNNGTLSITDSLYAPAALKAGETEITGESCTFARNGTVGDDCRYTRSLGTA